MQSASPTDVNSPYIWGTNNQFLFEVDNYPAIHAIGSGNTGGVVIGSSSTTAPAALFVSGTVRLGNGGEACDANRTGAIRYTAGDFSVCRNGTAWETLTAIAAGATPDRIASGTTSVVANSPTGVISFTQLGTATAYLHPTLGLVAPGVSATGGISATAGLFMSSLGVGQVVSNSNNPNGNNNFWVLGTIGVNATSSGGVGQALNLRNSSAVTNGAGTGMSFTNGTVVAGRLFAINEANNQNTYLSFSTRASNVVTERMRITSSSVGINLDFTGPSPTAALEVSGTISTTVVQVAAVTATTCTMATIGQITRNPVTGRLRICRL